jgi:hypothetical protein
MPDVTHLPPPLHADRLACMLSYDGMPLATIEAIVERAAIIEYNGKISRERAESAALAHHAQASAQIAHAATP